MPRGFCYLTSRLALVLAWAIAASTANGATLVTLVPSADTTLMEVATNNNAGGRAWLAAGSNMHNQRNRALLKFDIASSVPSGAVVVSASLAISVTGIPADGYNVAFFSLHRMLRDWGEGTNNPTQSPGQGTLATTNEATWLSPFAGTPALWGTPGAAAGTDYVSAASATQIIYSDVQSPYTFPDPAADPGTMIAEVQHWLSYPSNNFGWLLQCDQEDLASTARRFGSREDPDYPPLLSVGYLLPPHLEQPQSSTHGFQFVFVAEPGQNYQVQFRDLNSTNAWQVLTNFIPALQPTPVTVQDDIGDLRRSYRVSTW